MKKHTLIFALLIAICMGCNQKTKMISDIPTPDGWTLIWHDEFDGKEVDTAKWNILIRETSKHEELQYYIPEEVYLEGGNLRIRSSIRDYGDKHYTSGRLDTKDKLAITYGRFEIRGKLPVGQGIWPAYWLYPQNRDWAMECLMSEMVAAGKERSIPEFRPWYTEIDIMEFLGHEPNIVYGTYHYRGFKGDSRRATVTHKTDFDLSEEFHLYVLEWEPDAIRWYIDDKLILTAREGVPHAPHFLIMNTAIGGTWPGNPDSTTVFPQYHDIDYVRVYQRK